MELQALLVLCGVGVAGLAMLLLMGLFSASGTSYEEAIAQQRRATTELLALAESKNKPKKKEKKANKKLAKKEKSKESSVGMTGSEQESEAPAESGVEDDSVPAPKGHVEFSSAVVVDVPRDTTPNVKIRKRGKDPKVKPILVNKEDPSCVSDPSALPDSTAVTVANHFEEMHPKDEFELMHSTLVAEKVPEKEKVEDAVEKKDTKSVKPAKGAKAVAKPPTPVEIPKEEPARERHNSGESAKEQRKGKKIEKKPVEEVVESPREEVVPPLNAPQPSELTTDKLLKQALANAPVPAPASSPPGKNKKKKPEPNVLSLMVAGDSGGVNVGELVRVVREAALSRTEIQILTDALLNKHHDPLPEHSEWTEGPNDPMQKLKKQLADKEKALADEIEASQALHAKLKELRTALNAERTRALATARAADQAAANARAELHTLQARLQRLHDDNHQLGQEKLMLQSKLAAEAEAQAARVQMELHIQRLSESEAALVAQLTALQGELQAGALEAGQRAMELAAARDAASLAQQHAADLAQQLQDASRALADLDAQRHAAQRQEQRAQQERAQAVAELQNEVQKVASRAQIAENNLELLKEESEKQKQQLTTEIASLREQLAARETELAEIKQLKATPAQNGLPANDQLKAAELAKVESIVESLRDELAAAQRSSRDQRDQVARLQEQLRSYQDKNNELRTKNWKVMEALQSAEKALQMKAASAMPAQDSLREAIAKAEEAQYNEVASVLRKACPSAAPDAGSGRDWLQDFARNLQAQLQRSADSAAQDRLNDLIQQNEQSQSLVEKYKRIIDDTEGVLSRLQQNVTLEEQRWAQQLADKQRELDDLRQRTVMQMQNKIDSLQEELHQAKKSNHNHTFADAERTAEERLMAGLSDKHSVDVSNGPLQVGLEEK
ncbi:ribosome-binding protein 1 isoform X1 [Spodoptera litura]|uniref:Ribosome-binding protein 1 isoform X1 n=1 Tax=Spodoptera litura TaxID=69820 RepID=A0A9J7DW79_SPOLT|nr:ribosome-binding protein 1 isoform X1 [Spodoptera litura]XP_022817430.1 ribosome-binding protein 1 isoform X1 [Spodoptera litura]